MTDALKTALHASLWEVGITAGPEDLNAIVHALTRRGVVVQGDGQREAKNALIRSVDTILHEILNRNDANPKIKQLAGEAHGKVHDLAGVLSDDPAISSAAVAESPTPPRSDVEAVAPVRKVVQIVALNGQLVALCNDGTILRNDKINDARKYSSPPIPDEWLPACMPIPQPGAEP